MTHYQWYAVRCCCQPTKVLGFIRLPSDINCNGGLIYLPVRPHSYDAMEDTMHDPVSKRAEVQFKPIRSINTAELAIYSDDRPIEFWREVIGFVEAKEN